MAGRQITDAQWTGVVSEVRGFLAESREIVIQQNPPAGVDVPLGPAVEITMVIKEAVPTKKLGVADAVSEHWPIVRDLLQAVSTSTNPPATALRNALDHNATMPAPGSGSGSDHTVLDTFLSKHFTSDALGRRAIYDDVAMIWRL
jgi:hypothetical protein